MAVFIHSLHMLSNATAPMLYTMKVPLRLRYLGAVYSSPMTPSHVYRSPWYNLKDLILPTAFTTIYLASSIPSQRKLKPLLLLLSRLPPSWTPPRLYSFQLLLHFLLPPRIIHSALRQANADEQ
jgi:hypothetical protein